MKTYRIAAIPGDGIGTEVVAAGIEVLQALAEREGTLQFTVDHFDWGGAYYKKHGRMMPENGRSLIRNHDAILFGSAGHPDIPDHITLWGLRLAICQPFSDLAAALAGSLGIAPTANLNPERSFPSMFEPIHGSAFDIMGKGIANPVGTFWSAVLMLEHLGEKAAADRLMKAVERVTADQRFHTPDLGGKAKTADVTAAVIDAIIGANA